MSARHRTSATVNRAGQAMAEFLVALVALLFVLTGIIQVAALTRARMDAGIEAREQVAQDMLADTWIAPTPSYIQDWENGPDGRAYTADDKPISLAGADFQDRIVDHTCADAGNWSILQSAPDPRLAELREAAQPAALLGLVNGRKRRSVPLIPLFGKLLVTESGANTYVYDVDTLEIKEDVWMTWTKGL